MGMHISGAEAAQLVAWDRANAEALAYLEVRTSNSNDKRRFPAGMTTKTAKARTSNGNDKRRFPAEMTTRIATAKRTAGSFDKLRTGSSTASFAKCANDFAQDDTVICALVVEP